MLGLRKKPEEVIKKEEQKKWDEGIKKASRLKKVLLSEYSGWADYCEIIQGQIDHYKKMKAITLLHQASPAVIEQLKLADKAIWELTMALQIPKKFIDNLERELEKRKEKENASND